MASISIESKKFLRATTLADSLCKHDYSPNPVTSSAKQANKFSAKEMLDVSWSLPPKPERSELYMLVESMPTPSAASGLNIFISIAYIKQKYYIYICTLFGKTCVHLLTTYKKLLFNPKQVCASIHFGVCFVCDMWRQWHHTTQHLAA